MPDYRYHRLSQLDNSFFIYEDSSSNAYMHVGAVQIYEAAPLQTPDGGLDVDRIQEYVLSRLPTIPRYRQRLERIPVTGHPIWVDDARFNVHYHLRHTRLPHPGDERLLKRLTGRIMSQELDRGKPLWEMWLIEGLTGNRFAILSKTHHSMIDGVSGVDLMSQLMSPEPTETIPAPSPWIPRPTPGPGELLADEVGRLARTPVTLASMLWRLARDEDHARHQLQERVTAATRVLGTSLSNASSTPLNQAIGPFRRIDWHVVEMDDVRAVKNALGGTVNDVVLATVAGAIRRFLGECRQVRLNDLDFRVMAPVSVRGREQHGTLGNRVSAWILNLPIREPTPLRRLEEIRKKTGELKANRQALGAETLTQVTEWTGSTLLSLGARLATWGRPFNMVVTNVPGPRIPLYLLGSRMLEAHPMVPLFGNLATGIALFSYDGKLSWGLSGDWDLFPDLHDLVEAVDTSFRELREEARAAGKDLQREGQRRTDGAADRRATAPSAAG